MTVYTWYLHPESSGMKKCLTALTVHERVRLNSKNFPLLKNQIWTMQGAMQIKERCDVKVE